MVLEGLNISRLTQRARALAAMGLSRHQDDFQAHAASRYDCLATITIPSRQTLPTLRPSQMLAVIFDHGQATDNRAPSP